MDAEVAEQLARRDRHRHHRWAMLTWEERLAALDRHQTSTAATLRQSPGGYGYFLRRNYRARSTDWAGEPRAGRVA